MCLKGNGDVRFDSVVSDISFAEAVGFILSENRSVIYFKELTFYAMALFR